MELKEERDAFHAYMEKNHGKQSVIQDFVTVGDVKTFAYIYGPTEAMWKMWCFLRLGGGASIEESAVAEKGMEQLLTQARSPGAPFVFATAEQTKADLAKEGQTEINGGLK